MNRFEYLESKLLDNEIVVAKEKYTKFYNGNEKVNKVLYKSYDYQYTIIFLDSILRWRSYFDNA